MWYDGEEEDAYVITLGQVRERDAMAELVARAQIAPGEPVGLVAAQTVGEKATQKTLNAFHHTGKSLAKSELKDLLEGHFANRLEYKFDTPQEAQVCRSAKPPEKQRRSD